MTFPDLAKATQSRACIQLLEEAGTEVYAPVKDEAKKRAAGVDPFARRKGDSDAIAAWRERIGTDEAKDIYRQRGVDGGIPQRRVP